MLLKRNLLCLASILLISFSVSAKKINVLVVTGGHGFDRQAFFEMFDSFSKISYTELEQPEANGQLGTIDLETFDAVVFYDMPKVISEADKKNYDKLILAGKGLVFLHHSLASYQQWDEYISYIGGKYHEEKDSPKSSTYQHDVTFKIHITDPSHPVTKGISDFEILDEVYGNTEVLSEMTPLLTTGHPESNRVIGWIHQKGNSRIVYIQPGHNQHAFTNNSYCKLVQQAIAYVAKK